MDHEIGYMNLKLFIEDNTIQGCDYDIYLNNNEHLYNRSV